MTERFMVDDAGTLIDMQTRDMFDIVEEVCPLLNELSEENEQLKQRNDRQAKRLGNLYHLIEKEDWKTLKGIIQEFQECEEQLQLEWQTDWEKL